MPKLITTYLFIVAILPTVLAQTHEWTRSFGDVAGDICNEIAVDESGNVYSTGFFAGTIDFDPGPGVSNVTYVGNSDAYIQKMDSYGNHIWSKSFGGFTSDVGHNITVDQNENVYSAGIFGTTADLDPGVGVANYTTNGNSDIYIQKLDPNGDYLWSKTIGGIYPDYVYSMALDSQGDLYLTGFCSGVVDFDPGPGVFDLGATGSKSFILKLDANGDFIWARSIAGSSNKGYSLAIDSQDNVLVTGYFEGTVDFDPGVGVSNVTSTGYFDAYFLKLDSSGDYLWSKTIGNSSYDNSYNILTDSQDNIYAYGYFNGTLDMDPGAGTAYITNSQPQEGFLLKLDASGNYLWANLLGGVSHHYGRSIAITLDNNVLITGKFNGVHDFDSGPGVEMLTALGSNDLFIQKFQSNSDHLWVKTIGSSSSDEYGMSIATDNFGNFFCGGYFASDSLDFDPGTGTEMHSNTGVYDIFVQKYNSEEEASYETITANELRIYPNPSSHTVHIRIPSEWNCKSIQLIDLTGKTISEVAPDTDHTSLMVDAFESGVYYIVATNEHGSILRKKVVVE